MCALRRLLVAVTAVGLAGAAARPDLIVTIRDRGQLSDAGLVEGVTLTGEARSEAAAERLGYRSMRQVVNIDCARRRDLVVSMTVYDAPGGRGAGQPRRVPGGWVQPLGDAHLAGVVREICREPRARPAASAQVPRHATAVGGVTLQVAAAGSRAQAEAALNRLSLAPPLSARIEAAEVGGRTFHRALVAGFVDRAAAKAWCEQLKSGGGACFVR